MLLENLKRSTYLPVFGQSGQTFGVRAFRVELVLIEKKVKFSSGDSILKVFVLQYIFIYLYDLKSRGNIKS